MIETSSSTRVLILIGIFIAALVGESIWPLRKNTESKFVRLRRNLGVAAVSMILMRLAFLPFEIGAAEFVSHTNIGLLNWLHVDGILRLIVSLVLLDYTLYFWHFLNHKIPFLWRFHNAHHTDLDLDASTASRFHFGELALSTFYRVAQIFVFGIDVPTVLLFETCITGFALFHHANLRLPLWLERQILKVIVAPRMHGIHHSIIREETDSNFGTILTLWDRVHRTLMLTRSQDEITIGVPSYRVFSEQRLIDILAMPFHKQREWILPTGEIPQRNQLS